MKDKQLFQHIYSIVNQKKNISLKQHPSTFAEKYCKQQILKKKLTPYDPNSKMNHLMSKFLNLQTYINLQQVIKLLKNKNQVKKKQQRQSSINVQNSFNKKLQKKDITQNQTLQQFIRKKIGRQIVTKYQSQNERFNKVLSILEQNSSLYSQSLKNNSPHGQNLILQEIQKRSCLDQDQVLIQISQYRKNNLGKFNQQKQNRNINQSHQMDYKSNTSSLKQNKNRRQLLHKISTYLQIILQSQHKNKWQEKRNKTIIRKSYNQNGTILVQNQNKPQTSQNYRHSSINGDTFLTQFQNQYKTNQNKAQKDSSNQKNKQKIRNKSFIKNLNSISFCNFHQQKYQNTSSSNRTLNFQKRNTNFKITNKSSLFAPIFTKIRNSTSNLRQNASFYQKKKQLNKDFTFKNRYYKKGVMKKINQFINLIDTQEHINKHENRQINKALSKFQYEIKRQYEDFKQEPLSANDEDIQDVKRMALQSKCARFSLISEIK